IAPYGIMRGLGTIWWCTAAAPRPWPSQGLGRAANSIRQLLGWLGIATALAFAVPKFLEGIGSTAHLIRATSQLDAFKERFATLQPGTSQIAIIGPAAPALSAAYWT